MWWQNGLMVHFSECVLMDKWCMTVYFLTGFSWAGIKSSVSWPLACSLHIVGTQPICGWPTDAWMASGDSKSTLPRGCNCKIFRKEMLELDFSVSVLYLANRRRKHISCWRKSKSVWNRKPYSWGAGAWAEGNVEGEVEKQTSTPWWVFLKRLTLIL